MFCVELKLLGIGTKLVFEKSLLPLAFFFPILCVALNAFLFAF